MLTTWSPTDLVRNLGERHYGRGGGGGTGGTGGTGGSGRIWMRQLRLDILCRQLHKIDINTQECTSQSLDFTIHYSRNRMRNVEVVHQCAEQKRVRVRPDQDSVLFLLYSLLCRRIEEIDEKWNDGGWLRRELVNLNRDMHLKRRRSTSPLAEA